MPIAAQRFHKAQRIVAFRALQLGDMLCAVPAFRALRKARPEAAITLVGLPWARDFAHRYNRYIDHFLEFPGFPGLPEVPYNPCRFVSFLSEVRARKFDLALQLHGDGSVTNRVVILFQADLTVAFHPERTAKLLENAMFLPYPDSLHEAHRNIQLLSGLGVEIKDESLEFPLSLKDELEATRLIRIHRLSDFVCVHPGARAISRRWDMFPEVVRYLRKSGFQVVLTGSSEEWSICNDAVEPRDHGVFNFAGETSIGGVAALLTRSRLLICNDTGISHIAGALRVPSVVLFTTSDPHRWAPLNRNLHRICVPPVTFEAVKTQIERLLEISHAA